MIERCFDPAFFNDICNRPEVRPTLGGAGPIDTTDIVTDPKNIALRAQHGGFILQPAGAGSYGVHTQFAAEGRGAHAIAAMQAGLDFMFTRTDAMRIFSHCPDTNPAALGLALKGRARRWFRKEQDELGPGTVVVWDILDWAVNTPALEAEGREFHEMLERAKAESGSALEVHADDPIHDRVVGAAVRMCRRGQAAKAVLIYNQWAAAADYAQIRLLADNPPVIDVVDAIVSLSPSGKMEVLQCR